MKARLETIYKNIFAGSITISFNVDNYEGLEALEELKGKDLSLEVKEYSEKRSLDANAYFHVLCGEMAKAVGCSKPYMKNSLLQRYGNREIDDNGEFEAVLASESLHLEERDDIHCMPVGYRDGLIEYGVYQPSHTLSKQEFKYLLEGTISEAKELGIQTMTPSEIAHLASLWKEKK